MQLTKEQIERAAACESAAELQAPAKSEGIALTDEEAEAYFAELTDVQVSDDELDAVSGGGKEAVTEAPDDFPGLARIVRCGG